LCPEREDARMCKKLRGLVRLIEKKRRTIITSLIITCN
jgi:hypothetical protein